MCRRASYCASGESAVMPAAYASAIQSRPRCSTRAVQFWRSSPLVPATRRRSVRRFKSYGSRKIYSKAGLFRLVMSRDCCRSRE